MNHILRRSKRNGCVANLPLIGHLEESRPGLFLDLNGSSSPDYKPSSWGKGRLPVVFSNSISVKS